MSSKQRQFPRIRVDKPAELDVATRPSPGTEPTRLAGTIRSLSCEGLGLALDDPTAVDLPPGSPVTIRFLVEDKIINIPGRIAWQGEAAEKRPFNLGIHLELDAAGSTNRAIFAPWIVQLTAKSREDAEKLGDLATVLASVEPAELRAALDEQRIAGGNLTDILTRRDAISPDQIAALARYDKPEHATIPANLELWLDAITSLPEE